MLFCTIKANCQTVDTTIKSSVAAPINQVIYKHDFPQVSDTLTYLGYFPYTDDTRGNCTVPYILISNGINKVTGTYKLTDSDYNNWDSSQEGLLRIIAHYLGITFK